MGDSIKFVSVDFATILNNANQIADAYRLRESPAGNLQTPAATKAALELFQKRLELLLDLAEEEASRHDAVCADLLKQPFECNALDAINAAQTFEQAMLRCDLIDDKIKAAKCKANFARRMNTWLLMAPTLTAELAERRAVV